MFSSNNLLTILSILYLCFFVIIHITLGAKLVVESNNDNDDNSLVDSIANFDIFNKHKDLQLTIDGTEYNFKITFDFFAKDPNRIHKFCEKISDEFHFQQCKEELTKRVENALLLLYLDHAAHMANHLVSLGFDMRLAEGGSMYFINLLKIKFQMASNKNIKTICETGFNLGHSSLLWLTSNIDAQVYSFDLGEHDYVIPSANYLNKHYPNRIRLGLGDSRYTLPKFFTDTDVKCDLFFVDGGHVDNVPQLDMFWAITMLNKTNPDAIILIDDLHLKDVKVVWNNMIKGNLIKANKIVAKQLPSFCITTDKTFSTLIEEDENSCEHFANMQKLGLNRSMYALDFGIASICSNNFNCTSL